jgi:hypothetical protein
MTYTIGLLSVGADSLLTPDRTRISLGREIISAEWIEQVRTFLGFCTKFSSDRCCDEKGGHALHVMH